MLVDFPVEHAPDFVKDACSTCWPLANLVDNNSHDNDFDGGEIDYDTLNDDESIAPVLVTEPWHRDRARHVPRMAGSSSMNIPTSVVEPLYLELRTDIADRHEAKTHEVFFDFFDDLPDTDGGWSTATLRRGAFTW